MAEAKRTPPSAGGSYTRDPKTGALTPAGDRPSPAPTAAADTPTSPAAKTAAAKSKE